MKVRLTVAARQALRFQPLPEVTSKVLTQQLEDPAARLWVFACLNHNLLTCFRSAKRGRRDGVGAPVGAPTLAVPWEREPTGALLFAFEVTATAGSVSAKVPRYAMQEARTQKNHTRRMGAAFARQRRRLWVLCPKKPLARNLLLPPSLKTH